MSLSPEIIQAAQRLGSALQQSSTVQSYLDQVSLKEQTTTCEPKSLLTTHQVQLQIDPGGQLFPTENPTRLSGTCCLNSLFNERDQHLEELQILFTNVSEVISSILTVDYRSLVGKE